MKKLTILICVLAMLLALTSAASASKPEEGEFTIIGWPDPTAGFPEFRELPSGRTYFHLNAIGYAHGRIGGIGGALEFEEWGIVDYSLSTGDGSGRGTNHGIMTIVDSDGSSAVVKFRGQNQITDVEPCPAPYDFLCPMGLVEGTFTVLHGTGAYAGLHGQGTYTGNLGLVFTVKFSGRFHTDPR